MCGPKFRPPPYKKNREDANLLPISKPFVSWRALFKTNQCFLQYKLGCISTFWQRIDKPKDKFIRNYAFCKNATYIKTNFQIKKGPLQNLSARKSTLSGPHIPVPTFPLSTPPPGLILLSKITCFCTSQTMVSQSPDLFQGWVEVLCLWQYCSCTLCMYQLIGCQSYKQQKQYCYLFFTPAKLKFLCLKVCWLTICTRNISNKWNKNRCKFIYCGYKRRDL